MNFKQTNRKKHGKLLILVFAIIVWCIFWSNQSIAVDKSNGGTNNGSIYPQLMNSNGSSVSRSVNQLSKGDTFWITGYGNTKKQVFRSPAILCSEKVNSLTTAQNGSTTIKYKINRITRVTTISNHTAAEKGLAYLVSFSRNGGNNFGSYDSAQTNDSVQNAFWTYTANNRSNIHIIKNIGSSEGKNVGNASEINNWAEEYKEYVASGVSTTSNISNVQAKWNKDYSVLQIKYNLQYNATSEFGKAEVKINYNGKEIPGGNKNGDNIVTINSNTIPGEGCNFTINAKYSYTYVDSTICDFVDARSNPKYRGQNLVIVSGERRTKTTTSKKTGKIPPKVTNVSMQKYITKVINQKGVETKYSGRENKYAQNLSGDNWKWRGYNHSAKISNMNDRKEVTNATQIKKENELMIEAGDTVEYTIEVYNNGKIATNITLYDKMINTGEVIKILKDGKEISNQYIEKNIGKPTEYREGVLYNFNLNGGKTAVFKVYVKYGNYHINYSKEKLMNQAYIKTNLQNTTTYRTIDADYVLMKKYEVSLEKWVSNISRTRPGEEQITLIDKQYGTLINYLQNLKRKNEQLNYTTKLNELIDNYAVLNKEYLMALINHPNALALDLNQYLNLDLDDDKKITQNDLEILRVGEVYSNLGENAKTIIEQYINADLNNDGNVDINDFKIYKVLRANLYKEQEIKDDGITQQDLNEKDKYMFLVKEICKNNQFNNNTLNYLKLAKLKKVDLNYQKTINNYIKSDINENGVVNTDDNYKIEGNKVITKYIRENEQEEIKEYELNITEQIKNLDINKIKELETYIRGNEQGKGSYDLNNDFQINETDIKLLEKYNQGEYNLIKEFEENTKDNPLEKMQKILLVNVTPEIQWLDLDEDGDIDYNDMKLSLQYDNNAERINAIRIIFENANFDMAYDFNNDGKTTYDDYEFIEEYQTIKNKIGEQSVSKEILEQIINNYNIYDEEISSNVQDDKTTIKINENSFSENDIHIIKLYKGLKQYKEEYGRLEIENYDFNNDDEITQEDLEVISNIQNLSIASSYVSEINSMQIQELDDFISLLAELLEDETKRETIQTEVKSINTDLNDDGTEDEKDYDLLKEIINDISNTDSNADEILTQAQEELYEAVKNSKYFYYEGESNLIQYIQAKNYLDANEDGAIDEKDIEYLNREYIISTNIEDKRDKINYLLLYDLNDDAVFDEKDIEIINHLKRYNCDIDEDNKYTEEDLNFLIEIQRLNTNQTDIQKIIDYLTGGNTNLEGTESKREGHAEYLTRENGKLIDKTDEDSTWTRHNKDKYSNVVTVQNNDYVTYTIKIKNDGDTPVYITKVIDTLPNGVQLENLRRTNGTTIEYTNLENSLIAPGANVTFTITVKVTESNMSIAILENIAEIKDIKNQYGIPVKDSTPYNNKDSDYIQLKDIVISGTVWNDKAFDKEHKIYDGLYNDTRGQNRCELDDIKVYLYRYADGTATLIDTTYTQNGGKYSFATKYIKASKVSNNDPNPWPTESRYAKRWNRYYSYYVVFEYDGVTYTSTIMGDINASNYTNNSNAKEDNGPVKETRKSFNDRFSTINNQSGINYTTKNEEGYLPQSNHVYNEKTMAMQSSTDLVNIGSVTEDQLQHINLGLRGRDLFDLKLDSDVYSTKVSVNGQEGLYHYNSNKVTVRKSDISVAEDAANFANEVRDATVGEVGQTIRTTDLDVNVANSRAINKYASTGLGIEVTYKITITNESQTVGTASKVIDYYDSRYTFVKAYIGSQELNTQAGESGDGFKSVMITTPETKLEQEQKMDIYVVYQLKEPTNTLNSLLQGTQLIPTYNMAEVYEYKTYTTNNNEATRGLLDKDSAPGSANTEKARLVNGTSKDTTVQYYFKAKDLSNLKYEDDTYAAPTLYFTKDDNGRKLSGTVFEDYTLIYGDDRIKSGNGVQDADKGEPGINGVTVELLEGTTVRYRVITGENGKYIFEDFLPGNYTIKYIYGNTEQTFIATAPNTKSYNGEDFQATNNTGEPYAKLLNNMPNYWYVYNETEGVSTARDNQARRNRVSDTVTGFTDLQMQVLNNARDGKQDATVTGFIDENSNEEVTVTSQEIINNTRMFATTDNFILEVEKREINDNRLVQKNNFEDDYHVRNMNFGIAEVPVTTIDIQKSIKKFEVKDSAEQKNTIAKITKNTEAYSVTVNPKKIAANKKEVIIKGLANALSGVSETYVENCLKQDYDNVPVKDEISETEIKKLKEWMNAYSISEGVKIIHGWNIEAGAVSAPAGATKIIAQIEDEKLQGAKLEITYEMIASMYTEKNFDNSGTTVPNIVGINDYIDNDLSYNESLGNNSRYWELTNYKEATQTYGNSKYECVKDGKKVTVIPKGTLDPNGTKYATMVKAKGNNPLLLQGVGTSQPAEITLERTLSATDSSIMDIITSSIDTYEYDNNLEITGLNYKNETDPEGKKHRDRVRNPERYIILAGSQHDTFSAETLSIIPPTGENKDISLYVIALISLGVLTVGGICIKKYVVIRHDK